MTRMFVLGAAVVGLSLSIFAGSCTAQSYGSDLHNTVMPASGGMAGVSLARPQDTPSALFGNPSTMTQYSGTTFTLGGAFMEGTLNVSHDGAVTGLIGGGPWAGKSEAEPSVAPAVAVIQELDLMGYTAHWGFGLTALSGFGTSFRNQPNSVGTSSTLLILGFNNGLAVDVNDKLSVGAAMTVGTGILDAILARNTGSTADFGVRGTFGVDYDLPGDTTLGLFYQTKMKFDFDDLFKPLIAKNFFNVKMDQPANLGIGLANNTLMDGKLLLAFDVLYKFWEDAELYKAVYNNQWAYAFGAQYCMGRIALRAGYSYSDNPIRDDVGVNVGGAVIGANATQYFQATELAAIYRHRITGGVGIKELLPNMDLDLFVGGVLKESQNFGTHTQASIQGWYTGLGFTWHFGKPACEPCAMAAPAH